jgi:lysyl-tRNA synthetase, class II
VFAKPDYHDHEEFQNRSRKLQRIQELNVEPYPAKWSPSHRFADLIAAYENQVVGTSEEASRGETPHARLAGRLVLFRPMGKNTFAHLQEGRLRLQVMFNREQTAVAGYDSTRDPELTHQKFIEKLLDLGDIVGVDGHLFRTMKGELTLFVRELSLLCKTLLPLPEKHSGLTDKEVRYRKRWLDLISHHDVQETFVRRSQIVRILRDYLHEEGFLEVETPVLQGLYGGASAKPFVTHLNALNEELFLRISLEIALKKLIVGGMDRVFEIGKVFRNEGIDRNHNPEFTLMEAYAAYWDYHDMIQFMEKLCERIALQLYGTTQIVTESGQILDFQRPWKQLTMQQAMREYLQIDCEALSDQQMRDLLAQKTSLNPPRFQHASRGLLTAFLFEELVEPHLVQPQHILDHPIETTPLCKPHRDAAARQAGLVERFESYGLSHELANAYSELNDPVMQRKLLLQQAERRAAGDEEANPLDEDFIEAICQGMPPTGGIGIGVDRLVTLFLRAHSIRDVIYFPLMKPPAEA